MKDRALNSTFDVVVRKWKRNSEIKGRKGEERRLQFQDQQAKADNAIRSHQPWETQINADTIVGVGQNETYVAAETREDARAVFLPTEAAKRRAKDEASILLSEIDVSP